MNSYLSAFLGALFVFFVWCAYDTGEGNGIRLCSSHPSEFSVLFGKGGNQ